MTNPRRRRQLLYEGNGPNVTAVSAPSENISIYVSKNPPSTVTTLPVM
jgi:hypothetical protein